MRGSVSCAPVARSVKFRENGDSGMYPGGGADHPPLTRSVKDSRDATLYATTGVRLPARHIRGGHARPTYAPGSVK